jgi:hypothetical protein
MAELEIHHETENDKDPTGQKVGVLAALLAVGLAIVTIASHRTHTAAIMHKSTANDEWSYYQATRIKLHNVELGEQLASLIGTKEGAAATILSAAAGQKAKYDTIAKEIQGKAEAAESLATADENRALRYDLGEGLMEIALVLSSLYFISKKKMFPWMGIVAGILGAAIAITGLLV